MISPPVRHPHHAYDASLKVYDLIYMMIDQSNPVLPDVQSLMYLFYREAFVAGNKGYASAIVDLDPSS